MSVEIRLMRPEDRPGVETLLRRTKVFNSLEIEIAMELIDEYLNDKSTDYICISALAAEPSHIVGYACYGLTPLTKNVYDLYWIATDPSFGRSGIGVGLMKYVETAVQSLGARLLVIETDSNPAYQAAVSFYKKLGYVEEARIKDFYAPGNDKIIFVKRFN